MANKRRLGHRELNGRINRSEEPKVDEREQVLNQPHRKKNESQQCGDVFGRFCLQHDLPMSIYYAGQKYLHMVIRWRTLMGVPVNVDARVDHTVSIPLTQEELGTMKGALRFQIDKLERKIVNTVGRETLLQIRDMIFDEREVPYSEEMMLALDTMARQLGYFHQKSHPFGSC
jgi:hypothetical protein